MRLGLQDKVAIVTGSGRGIGAESAQAVSEEGARLVITGIDQQAAAERCAALRRNGFPAIAVTAGVTRGADLERLVHSTPDAFGGVHVPANNAGFARNASITRFGDSDWHAGVLSRNRRKFRQPINVACPAPGRWGRPNSRVTSRHFDHGNASRTSRPDCSGLDEAD